MTETMVSNNEKFGNIYKLGQFIKSEQFTIVDKNFEEPWGGQYELDPNDAEKFIGIYFNELGFDNYDNLSPKILLLAPHCKQDLQNNNNKTRFIKVIEGPIGVEIVNINCVESNTLIANDGELVKFGAQQQHRLIGLGGWGIVAEI